jgi:hypothetical protein
MYFLFEISGQVARGNCLDRTWPNFGHVANKGRGIITHPKWATCNCTTRRHL